MKLDRIAILGGGPGGLYAARLLKLAWPDAQIDVYERGEADKTFGFGVGLAATTQRNLRAADQQTFDDILSASYSHVMSMQVGGRSVELVVENLRAIGRTDLLSILQKHARDTGVTLHFGSRLQVTDLKADLIVAADGASSFTREAYAGKFGAKIEVGRALYLWCGTDFALPRAVFSPVTTEHGPFVTHAYPYAPDKSTFLIETDEATWRRAGFDVTTEALAGDLSAASDEASLRYLEGAFVGTLHGHRLIGNRTRWLRFRTITCATWHHENIVLLGDAAHTAHYSIGSGTKLAMEDAIALRQSLEEASTLEAALHLYEQRRRPSVEHLQAIARRSQDWWDAFPERLHLSVERLFVAFMTRAGKVSLDRFAETNREVLSAAMKDYRGEAPPDPRTHDPIAWILDGHVVGDRHGCFVVNCPFVGAWSEEADRALEQTVAAAAKSGATSFWVTGPADRERVLDRLDFAERLKLRTKGAVVAAAPEALKADLAAALVSGRTDLVAFEDAS